MKRIPNQCQYVHCWLQSRKSPITGRVGKPATRALLHRGNLCWVHSKFEYGNKISYNITKLLSETGKTFRKIKTKDLDAFLDVQKQIPSSAIGASMKTYNNSKIRKGEKIIDPVKHVEGYIEYFVNYCIFLMICFVFWKNFRILFYFYSHPSFLQKFINILLFKLILN